MPLILMKGTVPPFGLRWNNIERACCKCTLHLIVHYSIDCYDGQRAIKANVTGLEAVITAPPFVPPRGAFWCLLLTHPRVNVQKDCRLAFSWITHGLRWAHPIHRQMRTRPHPKTCSTASAFILLSYLVFTFLSSFIFFLFVTLSSFWQVVCNFLARFSPRKQCGVCVQMENCIYLMAYHLK